MPGAFTNGPNGCACGDTKTNFSAKYQGPPIWRSRKGSVLQAMDFDKILEKLTLVFLILAAGMALGYAWAVHAYGVLK